MCIDGLKTLTTKLSKHVIDADTMNGVAFTTHFVFPYYQIRFCD